MKEINDVAKATVRGSYLLFLGMFSQRILMAISSIIIARFLGPDQYGLYTLIFIVPQILIVFSDVGISSALTRFTARFHREGKNKKVEKLIKIGIFFKLIITLILSILLLIASEQIASHILNRPGTGFLIRISSLYLYGQAIFLSIYYIFISLDETKKSGLLLIVQSIVRAVFSPLLIVIGLGVTGAILGAGIGWIIASITGFALLFLHVFPHLEKNSFQNESIKFSQGIKTLVNFGLPMYLTRLISSLQIQTQGILLGHFSTNISIGNFNTAKNLTTFILVLTQPLGVSLFPAFSKLDINQERKYVENMFKLSVKYSSLIIVPASIALSILSKDVVSILYGSQYATASNYLSLYLLNFLLVAIGMNVIGSLFNSQGDTRTAFKMNLIKFVIFLPLALILIYQYGVVGLIISIFTSQFISTVYGLRLVKNKYGMNIELMSSIKILLTSLMSALIVVFLLNAVPSINHFYNLSLGGAIFIITFMVFAPLIGAINQEDIENLDSLTKELNLIYPIVKYILKIENKFLSLSKHVHSKI